MVMHAAVGHHLARARSECAAATVAAQQAAVCAVQSGHARRREPVLLKLLMLLLLVLVSSVVVVVVVLCLGLLACGGLTVTAGHLTALARPHLPCATEAASADLMVAAATRTPGLGLIAAPALLHRLLPRHGCGRSP